MKKILSLATLVLAIIALVALIIFLLKGGNEKEKVYVSHDVIVQQIEELGNLEVVKYNIQDVMEYRKLRRWLPNSRTSLKIAGEVIACVDLTKIEAGDIYVKGDSVSVVLPIPEVCHYKVDHSRSEVYNIEFGWWETAELVDEAYKEAEMHIYQAALNMGIAKESRENAVKVLTPILKGLGFKRVSVTFKSPSESLEAEQQSLKLIYPEN